MTLTYNGETKTVAEWAESLGLSYSTFSVRVRNLFSKPEGRCQRILQSSSDGLAIMEFNTVKEAEQATGITQANIRKCLCGHNKHAGGFKWTYLKN